MSRCKSCGAEIFWIKTRAGKAMPCDRERVPYWATPGGNKVIITPGGEAVRCELEGDPMKVTGCGYISHFATCPQANEHRRR